MTVSVASRIYLCINGSPLIMKFICTNILVLRHIIAMQLLLLKESLSIQISDTQHSLFCVVFYQNNRK